MKIFTILIFIVICFSACRKNLISSTSVSSIPIPWNDSSELHPKGTAYKNLLKKYYNKGLPGISLVVTDRFGTWVGSIGKADIERNISFLPGQVSQVASITKIMTAALVFKLMEDSLESGLVYTDLNRPIRKWLPASITNKIANGNNVSLGQLLNHESGIPEITEDEDFYLAVLNNPLTKWTGEDLLKNMYNDPPVFKPGDTSIYSSTNTLLVAMIIDAATNKNQGMLMKEKVFAPLGMHNSFYHPHQDVSNSAQGYYDLYNNQTLVNVSNILNGNGFGFTGVYSNIFDLKIFLEALLIKRNFLNPTSLALMERYGKADGSNRYGYGIMKKFIERGADAGIGHAGRTLGYTGNLFFFPNKNVSHIFLINYGTDGDSFLKLSFLAFQEELIDLTFQ